MGPYFLATSDIVLNTTIIAIVVNILIGSRVDHLTDNTVLPIGYQESRLQQTANIDLSPLISTRYVVNGTENSFKIVLSYYVVPCYVTTKF